MHMADALLSPAVGTTMWAATAAAIGYCARKVRQEADEQRVPLMGVLGAFVFTAQMINFSIPATGSSGHLGGGLLLAVLLGPHAAFLTIASVLTIQALFFADGGLLALGANIFNLGFFPCFIAFPLLYRPLAGNTSSPGRIILASVLAGVLGLQLGAFAVVLETVASDISALPFTSFLFLMQPIHLAIGLVEGLITAAVVNFVLKTDAGLLRRETAASNKPFRRLLLPLLLAAALTGTIFSWFASSRPDGLEWAIARITGNEELHRSNETMTTTALAGVQEKLSLLPDYTLPNRAATSPVAPSQAAWPAVDTGTSLAGLVGGLLTLVLAGLTGFILQRLCRKRS